MKKLISLMVAFTMFTSVSFADCDWKVGITKLPNGNYEYTKDCHVKVGETVRDLEIEKEKVVKLGLAIDYKEMALKVANERADLWMNTSLKLEAKVDTMESLYNRNKWLYFGLGILATSAAVYGAGQLKN